VPAGTLASVDLTPERLAAADAVVIATDHRIIDFGLVETKAALVIDTRRAV